MPLRSAVPGPYGFDANAEKVDSLEARLAKLRGAESERVEAEMTTILAEVEAARFLGSIYAHDEGALVPQLLTQVLAKPKEATVDSVVVSFLESLGSTLPVLQVQACTGESAVA